MTRLSGEQPYNVIGASVTRLEDAPLVRGRGLFAADVSFPFQIHMRVVRSAVAHGRIVTIDLAKALSAPGVVAAWIGAVAAVAIGGAGTMAVAFIWSRWFPELR